MSGGGSKESWAELLCSIEKGLHANSSEKEKNADKLFPLVTLEGRYREHSDYSKFMSALVDLKLTLHFCSSDFINACAVYNEQIKPGESGSRDDIKFSASKILFLNHLNAFILRCRAFWDKAMGILVLALNRDEYDDFLQVSKKLKFFKRVMDGRLAEASIEAISVLVDQLINKIRTAEAHLTGTLRTWVFTEWDPNPATTPFGDLLTMYNLTLRYSHQISSILHEVGNRSDMQASLPQGQSA